MKTYRISKVDNDKLTLRFEVYSYEDKLEGEEPEITISLENKYFYEGDWVYLDEKGDLHHIDEIKFNPILKKMNDLRNLLFAGKTEYYEDFLIAKMEWENYLGHPKLVTDEEKYLKDREGKI